MPPSSPGLGSQGRDAPSGVKSPHLDGRIFELTYNGLVLVDGDGTRPAAYPPAYSHALRDREEAWAGATAPVRQKPSRIVASSGKAIATSADTHGGAAPLVAVPLVTALFDEAGHRGKAWRSARCGPSDCSGLLRTASDCFGLLRTASDGFGWLQMASGGFGWVLMASGGTAHLSPPFLAASLAAPSRRLPRAPTGSSSVTSPRAS